MGDVTISEETLRQFIGGLERSAAAQEKAALTSETIARSVEQSTIASEKRQESIMASIQHAEAARVGEVTEIKEHIRTEFSWFRASFKMLALALVLAGILGVPLGRILSAVFRIKP